MVSLVYERFCKQLGMMKLQWKQVSNALQRDAPNILDLILTIPASSSECERGFSDILFISEKPLSHSADNAGIVSIRSRIFGHLFAKHCSLASTVVSSCQAVYKIFHIPDFSAGPILSAAGHSQPQHFSKVLQNVLQVISPMYHQSLLQVL